MATWKKHLGLRAGWVTVRCRKQQWWTEPQGTLDCQPFPAGYFRLSSVLHGTLGAPSDEHKRNMAFMLTSIFRVIGNNGGSGKVKQKRQ